MEQQLDTFFSFFLLIGSETLFVSTYLQFYNQNYNSKKQFLGDRGF